MGQILAYVLLIPITIWSIFQGVLYTNATMTEEALNQSIYEAQKEASLEGRYSEEIYREMRDYLVDRHGYNPDKISIKGTEKLTDRGGELEIQVSVPQPPTSVLGMFKFEKEQRTFNVKKSVLSEYVT